MSSIVKGIRQHALALTAFVAFGFAISTAVAWASFQGETRQSSAGRWIPRQSKTKAPLMGDQACAQCHKKQSASYMQSPMRLAMESVADSRVLSANPALTFRNGPYAYSITRHANQSNYTVTDGKETVTLPILYAFGQGKAGQTYIIEHQGRLYESLVSFYQSVGGLDFTVGHSSKVPSSVTEALGRPLSEEDVKNCFGCHSTGSVTGDKINFEKVLPGIHCEACHGPAAAHVIAIQSGDAGANLIFNPNRLSSDELSQEFCAACHRPSPDFEKLRSLQSNNVRFQPYRIFYSKCYSEDKRISCTACHNPHETVRHESAYYDAKCLACHNVPAKDNASAGSDGAASAGVCKVRTKDCVSCHMPKVDPPQAHFKFTDHYIRVVKSGEKYPN